MTVNGDSPARYEVVIVGGGPAGAAAAIELARAGRRVLLLDAAASGAIKIGETLPPAARPLLRDLGLWDDFAADGHLPCYGNQSAWGAPLLQSTDFIYDRNGHGWHLDRGRFDPLLRGVARRAGSEVLTGTRLERLARSEACDENVRWQLTLVRQDGASAEVQCGWLVDASGRRCVVVRKLGARQRSDDRLLAVYALFASADGSAGTDRDSRTLIEATPHGWWYSALVPSGQRVVAFLTDADLVMPRSLLRRPERFLSLLRRTLHVRGSVDARRYRLEGPPKITDARSLRIDRFFGDGWVAAGDAAISFDPLSSQGILAALFSGAHAGQALNRYFIREPEALEEYERSMAAVHRAYLVNRSAFYKLEGRWPENTFWKRRREAASIDI